MPFQNRKHRRRAFLCAAFDSALNAIKLDDRDDRGADVLTFSSPHTHFPISLTCASEKLNGNFPPRKTRVYMPRHTIQTDGAEATLKDRSGTIRISTGEKFCQPREEALAAAASRASRRRRRARGRFRVPGFGGTSNGVGSSNVRTVKARREEEDSNRRF